MPSTPLRRFSGLSLDLRLAFRRLRHDPTFTLATILILALGIGATTAIFSAVRGVLLRPLPFPDPDRLVRICEVHPSVQGYCIASPYSVREWGRESRTLREAGLGRDWGFTLTREQGTRESINGGWATPGLFRSLGFSPVVGRLFQREDLEPGRNRVVLLTEEFWRTEFGADRAVAGQRLVLDGKDFTIVGVLPAAAVVPGLREPRLWVPLPVNPDEEENRRWRGFQVIGRLASNASASQAEAELAGREAALGRTFPATHVGWQVSVTPLKQDVIGGARGPLWIFAASAGLLLLIACTNVAGLMLARESARGRELAVCAAMGSGRFRLVRLVLVESLLLGGLGGFLGLALGMWGTRLFVQFAPKGVPRLDEVRVDGAVLAFALATTLATVLLSGLVPALRAGGIAPAGLLTGGRTARRSAGLRRGLVVAEVALACLLLVGSGLVVRSLGTLLAWSPGFSGKGLHYAFTSLSVEDYADGPAAAASYERVLDAARHSPGVLSASLASAGPLFGGRELDEFSATGAAARDTITVRWFDASPGHFKNLGLRFVAGRDLAPSDRLGSPRVAVVNESFVRRLLGGGGALGREVVRRRDGESFTVIGVVADVPPLNPDAATEPELYWPLAQEPRWGSELVIRTGSDGATVPAELRVRLAALEHGLSVGPFHPYRDAVDRELVSPRFNVFLLGSFAVVALGIALAGIYGLMRYLVAIGARDAAIRLALGASPAGIRRWALRRGMVPVAIGLVVGLGLAAGLSRLIVGLLAGVTPTNPATYFGVVAALGVMAFLATWLPVRRIGRESAMALLRTE
jgi:predicted permease